jgi:hypothetical protein
MSTFVTVIFVAWYVIAVLVGHSHQSVRGHAHRYMEKSRSASPFVSPYVATFHAMIHFLVIAPFYGSVVMLKRLQLHTHIQTGHRKLQKKAQDKYQDWQRKKDARA